MYCPSCGTENLNGDGIRFCRSCGEDLRVVSRAVTKSLPLQVASALDSYLENRYQQNLRNGVLNVVAFVFLLIVGSGYLISGWTTIGILMLVLSLVAIVSGVWDIWIYKRNLSPVSKRAAIAPSAPTKDLSESNNPVTLPSVTESTTKHLDTPGHKTQ